MIVNLSKIQSQHPFRTIKMDFNPFERAGKGFDHFYLERRQEIKIPDHDSFYPGEYSQNLFIIKRLKN